MSYSEQEKIYLTFLEQLIFLEHMISLTVLGGVALFYLATNFVVYYR
jgi:hypothetical protein